MSQPVSYGCQYYMRQIILSARQSHVHQAVAKAGGTRPGQHLFFTTNFERSLWQEYGLTGDIDLDHLFKECQRRAREADGTLQKSTMLILSALDTIHKLRKRLPHSFVPSQESIWPDAEEILPDDQSKAVGQHFWAVLIGNNEYNSARELYGCINDTKLIRDYLLDHLGVPSERVRLLHNVSREAILNALYDLRDNIHIQFGDNILVHFSGHGSSYDAESLFETGVSAAGSIEAICPSDRSTSWEIPDISDRELNLIFSEVRNAKGANITFITDCCYSGGMMRATSIADERSNRSEMPIRLGPMHMLKAAEGHPRRKSSVLASSENWRGDVSAFVQLAACQDFQQAREVTRDGRTYGAFTWALVKVLKSTKSRGGTYTDVIRMIGRLYDQDPKAVGDRKGNRLWFK